MQTCTCICNNPEALTLAERNFAMYGSLVFFALLTYILVYKT